MHRAARPAARRLPAAPRERRLDRGGGRPGRGPGPVRQAAARPRAHLWPRPPDTLATRDRVACWTGRVGDAAAARVMLADLLPVRERVLGPEHLDTLATHYNLAYWTERAVSQAVASDRCLI